MTGIIYTRSLTFLSAILKSCIKPCLIFLEVYFVFLMFSGSLLAQGKKTSEIPKLKEALREATILFDEGYLEKVPPLLERSLKLESGSIGDKVRTYELLTTVYLFLKDEEKADNAYLQLLDVYPLYVPLEESATRDLIYFADGFITYPKFAIGLKVGLNLSNAQPLGTYTIGNDLQSNESYTQNAGYQIRLHLYYALTKNILGLVFEPTFSRRAYSYSEHLESLVPNGGMVNRAFLKNILIEAPEEQSWLDFPVLLRATVGKPEVKFYVETGLAVNFLLKSEFNEIRTGNNKARFDLIKESMRNRSNLSIVGGVGLNYRTRFTYLTIGIQYQNMFRNLMNAENRFKNNELIYRFGLVENDFTMRSLALNIGIVKPFYTSKKQKSFHFIEP